MAEVIKMASPSTETDVAVLQIQVKNIDDKVNELKDDVKEVRDALEKHSEEHLKLFKEMTATSAEAHKEMSEKITAIERWRWMMMGAGIVLGAMGNNMLGSLLK
jgi:predicted  nucleic acid-binding Zn-ribbon protein